MIGLNLAVITTDPPVLAFILLSLALAACPAREAAAVAPRTRAALTGAVWSGAALGVACDLKSTAWLAVPVMAVMFAARDGARAAGRFLARSPEYARPGAARACRPRPRRPRSGRPASRTNSGNTVFGTCSG